MPVLITSASRKVWLIKAFESALLDGAGDWAKRAAHWWMDVVLGGS
jgi:hypothetical protein